MGGRDVQVAQRTRSCSGCGRQVAAGARWCGGCGTPLRQRTVPVVFREEDGRAPSEAPLPLRSGRGWVLLVVAVALVAGAGLVAAPTVGADADLLGRLDDATGRSSLSPPVDDLRLLWRRSVELGAPAATGPPVLWDLGGAAVVGEHVVVPARGEVSVAWPVGAVPSPSGDLVLVDGADLVVVDPADGRVRRRAPLSGANGWQPVGAAVGWVADAAVLRDHAGVPGVVEATGAVRWVGEPTWHWDGIGHGTDWAVVTEHGEAIDRLLVVDGHDGSVHRDLGPVTGMPVTAVHGDTLAWAAVADEGLDTGLGHRVVVHGVPLDGGGDPWVVRDLPPTVGAPGEVRLGTVADAFVVHYRTAGRATSVAWLGAGGRELGSVAVLGAGESPGGWPMTAVVDDAVVHVSPTRDEIRVVDRRGVVRWSIPAEAGEGVVAAGGQVLVGTPRWVTPMVGGEPRGALHRVRLRLLDARTGDLRWARTAGLGQPARVVATLAGHVGVTADAWPPVVQRQAWFTPDTGRRRSGARLAAAELGAVVTDDLAVVGRVGDPGRLVLAREDGRLVVAGPVEDVSVADLLAGVDSTTGAPASTSPATVHDDAGSVDVSAASVTAASPGTGGQRWRTTTEVALDAGRTVLLADVVAVTGRDGTLLALDRGDGGVRWRLGDAQVTALTAGGEVLVAGTADGQVLVVDVEGTVRQTVRVGDGAVQDVAVVDGRVVAVLEGEVVGLGRGSFFVEPLDRVELP